jgi:hypothetical protein
MHARTITHALFGMHTGTAASAVLLFIRTDLSTLVLTASEMGFGGVVCIFSRGVAMQLQWCFWHDCQLNISVALPAAMHS